MTLEQIAQQMQDAISGGGLTVTETLLDTKAFSDVLSLMALGNALEYTDIDKQNIKVANNVLTASGTSGLYGTSGPLTITISGADAASRTCNISATLETITIGDLKTYQLINYTNFNPQQLPQDPFTGITASASSTDKTFTLSVPNETIPAFSLLSALNIDLTAAGFLLERTQQSGQVKTNFTLTGIFSLSGKVNIGISVVIPVSALSTQQWQLIFTGNVGEKPVSIGNLIQVAGGTNLFANLPPGFSEIGNFCLTTLTIQFNPQGPAVTIILIKLGTTSPGWDIVNGFSILGPSVSFLIINPFKDPSVTVQIAGTFKLGNFYLGVSMTAALSTGTWTIDMTSDSSQLQLGDLSNAPGGIDFGQVDLPSGLNTDMPIVLEKFRIIFNTRFRSLNSLTIHVYSTKSWDVLNDGKLVVGQPRFEFSITDPLNQFGQRDFSLLLSGHVTVVDMLDMLFTLSHPDAEQGWIMKGEITKQVPMTSFIDKLYGGSIDWPQSIQGLTLSELSLEYRAKTSTYTFNCALKDIWSFSLGNQTFSVDAAAVTFTSANGVKSGSISGTFNIFGLELKAGYSFSTTKKDIYFIFNNTIEVHYDGTKLTFQLNNTSLGDMMRFMVGLALSDPDFELPSPWDALNNISLNGFIITITLADKTVSFTYKLPSEVDLGFIKIKSLNITKTPGGQVNISLDCSFLGQDKPVGWDLANEKPPQVPGMGDKYFELKFAALGQRVKLTNAQNTSSVMGAIEAMQKAFPDPAPDSNPLSGSSSLEFNQGSNWLIGTHFIVMSAIDVAAVFNDPDLYGLSIGVSGDRFKLFKGLQFEILYKKLTETIGVYEIELKLPDAMRQLEFGQVSVTLPIIGISIYTNGGFKLDLGFPYNGDFSRSFTLQVFPFIGSGGFYFGYLGDAPSKRLPQPYNPSTGTFNPVIEFGLGLSVGIGKTISMGILSAGISITVQGIVEGTLAFFNANTTQYPALKNEMYYWLQGSVGIAGHVYGQVNFVIVKANVDLKVYAVIRMTYASYQPIYIYLEAGVTVSVSITIDLWLFSVTISFSFSATIRQSFTLPGQGGTPPWNYNGMEQPKIYRSLSLANTAICDPSDIAWKTFDLDAKDQLKIYLLPQFSAGMSENGDATSFYIASLFLRTSALKITPNTEEDDFDKLTQMLWVYAAAAVLPALQKVTDPQQVLDQTITAEQLDRLYCFLTTDSIAETPLNYGQVMTLIHGCFQATLQSPPAQQTGEEFEVALFPMIPDTGLKITKNGTELADVDFSKKTLCTTAYHQTILDYFEALVVQYENSTDPNKSNNKLYKETEYSLATFVFEDYFMLVMRQIVQAAIDLLKAYTYAWQSDSTFGKLATDFYNGDKDAFEQMAEANRDAVLLQNAKLKITGVRYPITADNNFQAVAAALVKDTAAQDAFLERLAAVNLETPQLIAQDQPIDIGGGKQFITRVNETLASLQEQTGVDAAQIVVLNKSRNILVALSPINIPEMDHTVTGTAETLGTVAQQFSITPAQLVSGSSLQTGLYAKEQPLTLPQLASMNVGMIRDGLIAEHTFKHLAGLASKFMLGGLRVPPPGKLGIEEPVSLYTLTGQQCALPVLDKLTDVVKIELTSGTAWPLGSAEYSLRSEDMDLVNTLRDLKLEAKVDKLQKQSFSKTEARKFNLSSKILWQSTEPVNFVNDAAKQPYTQASLWSLSPTLQTLLQQDFATLPKIGLYIGHQANPGLPMTSDTADVYSWTTLLKVQVRQLFDASGAVVPFVYELTGLDENGIALVEQIISYYTDQKTDPVHQVHVLFAPAASAAQPLGLISRGIDALSAFIVQSNLSTLSNPAAAVRSRAALTGTGNLLNTDTMTSLQLLWQCSIVKTGGYYFYYCDDAAKQGIPDTSFDSSHNALIYFALTLNITDGALPGFVNAAAIGNTINEGDLLYAASEQQLISVDAHVTPEELVRRHRTGWNRLAASLADRPLRQHVEIQITGAVERSGDGSLLRKPAFTFRIEAPMTLSALAERSGATPVRILFDNRHVRLFDAETILTVDDQWIYTYATIPAGNTVFLLERENPDQRSAKRTRASGTVTPQQMLSTLYNLLSFRVLDKAPFTNSVSSVPVGPADNNSAKGVTERRAPLLFNASNTWKYEQVLPVYRFWAQTKGAANGPQADRNPYLGVGSMFQLGFEWRDIYGNIPAPGGASIDNLPIRIGYYDDLVPLAQWPSTTASYLLTKPTTPLLQITLQFDANKYIPRQQPGCVPDPAQDPATFKKLAEGDKMKAATVFYQLVCDDIKARCSCNISSTAVSIDKTALSNYVAGIYDYLAIVSNENYLYTYYSADGVQTMEQIAQQFNVLLTDLAAVNPGTPDVPVKNTCLVIPVTPLPQPALIEEAVVWDNTQPSFELSTAIQVSRDTGLVDDQFLDVPSVYGFTSAINPATSDTDGKSNPYAYFATQFEQAFPGARVATGRSSANGGQQSLWVVQFNEQGYQFQIDGTQPFFYAPMPLFNQLVTGTDFKVHPYNSGTGIDKDHAISRNYAGVDLDVWASIFLSACDQVLSAAYLVPARIIDTGLQTTFCKDLLDAKRAIAQGIVQLVTDLEQKSKDPDCTNTYTPPSSNMLKAAKDALEQQLLIRLSTAYQVDAVVQYPVTVTAPVTQGIPPNLFGTPVARGKDTATDKEISLSTTRIAMGQGKSYLTFLFSTKRQSRSNYPLTLSFAPNAFEYDIHAVQSLNPDYRASSWLSFIKPFAPTAIGDTQIPVPLRAYPAPPSLKDQQVVQAPTSVPNIFLQQRQWNYHYAYEQVSMQQDLISTSLRFNVFDAAANTRDDLGDPDLFQVLAMFNYVWPELSGDLNTLVATVTTEGSGDLTAAKNTLEAFAWLMKKAGTAWNSWLLDREKYRDRVASHESYEYMIRENLNADDGSNYEMTVEFTGLKKDISFVAPYFEDYTSVVKKETGSSRVYQLYKTNEPTVFLTVGEAKELRDRTLVYSGLDILKTQNAWGGVLITRNKYLFTNKDGNDDTCRPTNDNFVYQTPTVRYSSILTPLLTYDQEIDLATWNGGKKLPLLDYLQLLFTNLFEDILDTTVKETTRCVQLSCTYYYSLTGEPGDELMVNLPVVLAPPYDFKLPDDWKKEDIKSYIYRLNQAIWEQWYEVQHPSTVLGRFVFEVSLYSSLAATQLPILRFSNIRLALADIG